MKTKIIKLSFLVITLVCWSNVSPAQELPVQPQSVKYICVKGDFSGEAAGKCSVHGTDLVRADSPSAKTLINEHTKISENQMERYVCIKGDVSQTKPGSCPNHNLQLENATREKVILSAKEEWQKESKLKNVEIASRFICKEGDFSDTKSGKCPSHGTLLINRDDEEARNIKAKAVK